MVSQATSMVAGLGGTLSIQEPLLQGIPGTGIELEIPEFQPPVWNLPDAPDAPGDFANLPCLEIGAAPVFTAAKPVFSLPPQPSQLAQPDMSPPAILTDLPFPDVPAELQTISLLAPVLAECAAPDAPALQMPVFDAQAPVEDLSAPTDHAERFEAAYRGMAPTMAAAIDGYMDAQLDRLNPRFHEQMARLEDKLAAYVEGGTALNPEVEDAFYERARGRNHAEYRRVRDTVHADAARRGFTLPDSVLVNSASQARQAAADNNARAALDIAIRQAELEQQNVQFALTTSLQLRCTLVEATVAWCQLLVSVNGMALDYAKSVLGASVEVYNTLVKAYGMRLDAYKAEAAVYETRLRGAMALVEIYKAEIGALESLSRVDMAKVELFKSRLEGLQTLASVYKSQIDAVLGKATVEKMKVEVFGEQVRAYAAQAQAKNAEWQGYTAAVNGQEALMKAFGTEAQAYSAEVDGYKAGIQARQAEIESISSYNKGKIDQYVAALQGYSAVAGANARVAAAQIDSQKTQLMAVQAKLGAEEANARLAQEYYKTVATLNQESFKTGLLAVMENGKLNVQKITAAANIALNGANVYGSMAAAAMSGMNTLVSRSDS
jgi:hypothetical protein